MNNLYIIIAVLALISLAVLAVSYYCFNDDDPDMYWYDNYAECQRPHVALKNHCPHTETTDVNVDAFAIQYEIWTICDDCSEVLKTRIDY